MPSYRTLTHGMTRLSSAYRPEAAPADRNSADVLRRLGRRLVASIISRTRRYPFRSLRKTRMSVAPCPLAETM